jgi:hypothetical protein
VVRTLFMFSSLITTILSVSPFTHNPSNGGIVSFLWHLPFLHEITSPSPTHFGVLIVPSPK